MANLSQETITNIRKMIAAVVNQPILYDQSSYPVRSVDPEQSVCGSACCGAGWAVWTKDKDLYGRMVSDSSVDWGEEATKALGLPELPGRDGFYRESSLFVFASGWPEPFKTQFREAYGRARTRLEQKQLEAQAFKERWEHFIATDGEDYKETENYQKHLQEINS